MVEHVDLLDWLRQQCAEFVLLPAGVYVEQGDHDWLLVAEGPAELTAKLGQAGHLAPLSKESAVLVNVIEVAPVAFLLDRLDHLPGAALCSTYGPPLRPRKLAGSTA